MRKVDESSTFFNSGTESITYTQDRGGVKEIPAMFSYTKIRQKSDSFFQLSFKSSTGGDSGREERKCS